MDYQTSRNQKKKSPTDPNSRASSSKHSSPSISESASIRYYTALANSSTPYRSPYKSPYTQDENRHTQPPTASASRTSATSTTPRPTTVNPSYRAPSPPTKDSLSTYSSSSGGSLYRSSPPGQDHRGNTSASMSSSKGNTMSSNDQEQLVRSLRTHRVNTLTELRRIEKLFASNTATDVTEAMTSAWAHYVNSNNLLSELRGMTKNYPFSSECLDAAKWKVIGDPTSTRSWNYCWLILTKIKTEGLIKEHARLLAAKPAMWGGRNPTASGVEKLATACQTEWTRAVDQMLRQWATPPCTR